MRRLLSCVAAVCGLTFALPVEGRTQDFQLSKLGDPSNPPANLANPNERFRIFANQLGVAISSVNLSPPETLGHSAFNFAIEFTGARVDTAPEIWPTVGTPPTEMLLMPSAHIRKGLPFSFEVGGRIAYLQYSRMTAGTVELKWALNEGFFFLPDLGVRGHATRLIGARDFGLTTAGVDIGLGKQFAIGGMLTLTPYVGWDLLWVNANSRVIDFRPDRTAEEAQANPTLDTGVFDQVLMTENQNNRFYAGLRFISYVFELGAEFSFTKSYGGKQVLAFSGKLGVDF